MWQVMIFVGMLAMTSYYSVAQEVAAQPQAVMDVKSTELATSMAVYRDAVLAYLHTHPDFEGYTVPENIVQSMLPSWYVMPRGKQSRSLWGNRVCPDKTVVVFANDETPINITKEVVKVSKRSATVGESLGDNTFYAPAKDRATGSQAAVPKGNAAIAAHEAPSRVALPGCANVAAGRPVWIASLH